MRVATTALCAILAITSLALAKEVEAPAVAEGTYAAAGTNADGSAYSGKVKIVRNGEAYEFKWLVGEESYDGVGLLNGSTLSVGFTSGRKSGVVVYTVKGNTLTGTWIMLGGDKTGTETLTLTK